MNEKSRPDMGEITAGDLVDIREDIVTLRNDLAKLVAHLTSGAKAELSDEPHRLYAKLSEEGRRSASAIARGVEERPLLSLLAAFGIGFIGGNLLRR